jgi:hypothetical protein
MLRHSSVLPSEINMANSSQQRNLMLHNSYSLEDCCYRYRSEGTLREQKVGEKVEVKLNPLASSAMEGRK